MSIEAEFSIRAAEDTFSRLGGDAVRNLAAENRLRRVHNSVGARTVSEIGGQLQ
jgi:hypothetical protein